MQEIMMIKKVQRRFTKTLHGYKALTYTDPLAKLGLRFWTTKQNFIGFVNFPHCLPGGMLTNSLNQEVVTLESMFCL